MKLPVLQSGFISLTEESLVQSEPVADTQVLRLMGLGKNVDASGNAFFYNRDVQNLFTKFNQDARLMRQFDFREDMLKVAIQAFGTNSALEWFAAQAKSPFLTSIHRQFLNDTLSFISTGKRAVSIESWLGLLSPREATAKDAETVLETNRYFVKNDFERIPHKLTATLSNWTGQANGFLDLMYFLGIVFSKEVIMSK